MKNFFQTIKNSIYSPEFYSQIPQKSFKNAFSYFFLLILSLTLIRTIFLIDPLVNKAPQQFKNGIEQLINCYPNDLEIEVSQGGQASSSAKQPYFVSCEGTKQASESAILVVDTKTPYSKDQFDKYKAVAWLNKDSLIIKSTDVEIKTYDLSKVKNFKLNKTVIDSTYSSASKYFVYIGPVLVLLSFLLIYSGYVLNLVYLLLLSLILLLLSSILKRDFSYPQIYKIGIYAITLPFIVEFVVALLKPWTYFAGFPFMFSLIILGVIAINFNIFNNPQESK